MSAISGEVEKFLLEKLEDEKARLAEIDAMRGPVLEEIRKLEASLHGYQRSPMGSGTITDDEIIGWLRENSSVTGPKRVPEIAAAFDGDGRGFSKRLPRMVRDGKIDGDAEAGYFAP